MSRRILPFPSPHFQRATATLPCPESPCPTPLHLELTCSDSLQPVLTTVRFPGAGSGVQSDSFTLTTPRHNARKWVMKGGGDIGGHVLRETTSPGAKKSESDQNLFDLFQMGRRENTTSVESKGTTSSRERRAARPTATLLQRGCRESGGSWDRAKRGAAPRQACGARVCVRARAHFGGAGC